LLARPLMQREPKPDLILFVAGFIINPFVFAK
jgi:hypothetical protein